MHEGPEVGKNLVCLGTQKAAISMELPMTTRQDEMAQAGWGGGRDLVGHGKEPGFFWFNFLFGNNFKVKEKGIV